MTTTGMDGKATVILHNYEDKKYPAVLHGNRLWLRPYVAIAWKLTLCKSTLDASPCCITGFRQERTVNLFMILGN